MTLEQLRQARVAAVDSAKAIVAKADADKGRDLTDDEAAQVETHTAEAERLKGEIAKVERRHAARASAAAADADLAKPQGRKVVDGEDDLPPGHSPLVATPGFMRDPARGFKNLGEQALLIKAAGPAMQTTDERLRAMAAATGAQQGIGAEGGFAVAPLFSKQIWDGMSMVGENLLARVDQYPVDGDSLTLPAVDETSRATGSRYGGIRAYWIAEAAQVTSSKTKLRTVKVEPHQLGVLCYATDKLLRNAPALAQYLTKAAPAEIVFATNDAIINGTGTGQPKGLMTSASIVQVSKETSQTAATVVTENIVKMMARMHPSSRKRAIFIANIDVEPQLMLCSIAIRNLAGSDNVGGSAVPIYNPVAGTLMGRPIVFVEQCQTLGTVGDILFWDPMGYVAGVQGGIEEAMSIHLRFDYAETAFRFLYAVDGQPWLAAALTPFKGSNTLSTHVSLQTR